jgi:hypothetical protein
MAAFHAERHATFRRIISALKDAQPSAGDADGRAGLQAGAA